MEKSLSEVLKDLKDANGISEDQVNRFITEMVNRGKSTVTVDDLQHSFPSLNSRKRPSAPPFQHRAPTKRVRIEEPPRTPTLSSDSSSSAESGDEPTGDDDRITESLSNLGDKINALQEMTKNSCKAVMGDTPDPPLASVVKKELVKLRKAVCKSRLEIIDAASKLTSDILLSSKRLSKLCESVDKLVEQIAKSCEKIEKKS